MIIIKFHNHYKMLLNIILRIDKTIKNPQYSSKNLYKPLYINQESIQNPPNLTKNL